MTGFTRTIKYLLIFSLIVLSAGCATSKKNTWVAKRKTAVRANTSQLGRNRYFFSNNYQKKLYRTYKGKKR
jgi:Tfp pilus assembly protein PilP